MDLSLIPQCNVTQAAIEIYNQCIPFLKTDIDSFIKKLELNENTSFLTEYRNNRLIGFSIADIKEKTGSILLLCVLPLFQGYGIGTKLLTNSEEFLYKNGAETIVLGCGTGKYLCQGVPYNNEINAVEFFEKHGYKASWSSIDMILKLSDFNFNKLPIPDPNGELTFRTAKDDDFSQLLETVNLVNPLWCVYFHGNKDNILLALHNRDLAGFVIIDEDNMPFSLNFGGRVGGFGCLGVIPSKRNMGIGLQLAARATQELKQKGIDYSYLGYTWLEDWYGRLGYKTYTHFWMGQKFL